MTDRNVHDAIDELDDLLDAERKALLTGALDDVARLHDRKVALIEELNALDHADAERLRLVSAKVGRNQDLLSSAADGVRAVARRLAAVRRVRTNLETYDSEGRRKQIPTRADRALEKRA